jgi:hypothetical protein
MAGPNRFRVENFADPPPASYLSRGWFDASQNIKEGLLGELAWRKAHELLAEEVAFESLKAFSTTLQRIAFGTPGSEERFDAESKAVIAEALRQAASSHPKLRAWLEDQALASVTDSLSLRAFSSHVQSVTKKLGTLDALRLQNIEQGGEVDAESLQRLAELD